ncbi:TIGR01621 family pseudouridine synthase [Teredinibacter sp. KSP-S5-2]|uniref:TIGR01621 family pseudouridine synthase n=1 Tax=Teredinibacter sp. KSP-S5-2 TaxID=3034506 RepID=UPI0029349C19|nr:TIGR01621 family pseudouridine synthase [Teredinibacter sp. KSP-S5-2]WNO11053.1 TIGR01621 family pseudouridine synthase [Teredinibacter sp. KSP-S5-2]
MFKVCFENDCFVVVHKYPGVSVQGDQSQEGLVSLVKKALSLPCLFPVHRLDKVTSGLVVLAKTQTANSELSQAFQQRTVDKMYIALSHKKPAKKMGLLAGDMEKSRDGGWKLLRTENNPAVTQFVSFGVGVKTENGEPLRGFLLKPYTGKTHQIRVALKSVGSPILGDTLYSGKKADRVYLHAYRLAFTFSGEKFHFSCLPEVGVEFFHDAISAKIRENEEYKWPVLPSKYL